MPDEPHRWYLRFGQEREGPFSLEDVRYLLSQKNIDGGTFAFHKGLESWTRLRDLKEFQPTRPAESQEQAPDPESETGPQGKMPRGWLSRLAAVVVALSLVSGGLYWAFILPSSQNEDRIESPEVDPDVRRLAEQLGDDPQAETVLSGMGSSAVPPLLQILDAESLDIPPERVRHVLIGIGPAAIAPLISYLKESRGDGRVRVLIVRVLGNIGGLPAIPGLVLALGDPSQEVQAQAIQALGRLEPEVVPALLNRLTGPVHDLSPQARKNLARALKPHAGPQMEPPLRQMQILEKDPEVRQALTEVLNQIAETRKEVQKVASQAKGQSSPAPESRTAPGTSGQPAAAQAPPVNVQVQVEVSAPQSQPQDIRVHASAEARASAPEGERTRDPEAAGEHADRGKAHLERREKEQALAEYQQAYLLNPLPMYYLIILELEADSTATADSTADSTAIARRDSLPVSVTLEEIHEALAGPDRNLSPYRDALGVWKGRLARAVPLGRDAGREQFLVRGEDKGRDFIAALPAGKRLEKNLQAESLYVWKGKLQGFKVIRQEETAQVLPVLLVDEVH